jgi:hypothetical protein
MKKYHILTQPAPVEDVKDWDLSNIANEESIMIKAQRLQARRWRKLKNQLSED